MKMKQKYSLISQKTRIQPRAGTTIVLYHTTVADTTENLSA